jgi:hypothetical protein
MELLIGQRGRWWMLSAAWMFVLHAALGQESFSILDTRSATFSNVTVVTKTDNDVFITHAGGFANVKIKDLDPDVLQQLGYASEAAPARPARHLVGTDIELDPKLEALRQQMAEQFLANVLKTAPAVLIAVAVGVFLVYLGFCYCFMLICKKAGHQPGFSVWIPGIQVFPLLRAAGMSGWWVLLCLIPFGALLVQTIWCFKIAAARGKTWLVGLLLWFPITYLPTLLYLAFSDGEGSSAPQSPHRHAIGLNFQSAQR